MTRTDDPHSTLPPTRPTRAAVRATSIAAIALVAGVTAAARAVQTPVPTAAPAATRPSPFVPPEPLDYNNHDGWVSIFDGQTLAGWDGNPVVWSVQDGAITASSTPDHRVASTHIIWQGGDLTDFELKLEVKLDGDIHSGIAYRSAVDLTRGAGRGPARQGGAAQPARAATAGPPPAPRAPAAPIAVPNDPRWTLYGPGLDFDADPTLANAGNVEDRGSDRREVAWRGGIVRTEAGKRPRLIGMLGDPDELKALIKVGDWNQLHIIARGNELTHIINGRVMTILIDEDPTYFKPKGTIGLQIESFGSGRVNFRNIWLRRL